MEIVRDYGITCIEYADGLSSAEELKNSRSALKTAIEELMVDIKEACVEIVKADIYPGTQQKPLTAYQIQYNDGIIRTLEKIRNIK